jgi:hypothetical protein
MPSAEHSDIRPVAAVLQDIVDNLQDIVGSELRLAKAEIREEVTKARSPGLLIAIGILSGIFTALFLLVTIGCALSLVMAAWAAALTVTIGVGVIAAICIRAGMKQLKTVHGAPKTVANSKGNLEWIKQQTR